MMPASTLNSSASETTDHHRLLPDQRRQRSVTASAAPILLQRTMSGSRWQAFLAGP
jgi:hypothetical protein